METAVYLAVADGVFDGVLDEIWDLIESVSEGFLIYSCLSILFICEIAVGKSILSTRLVLDSCMGC